jgi:hypothetical protein
LLDPLQVPEEEYCTKSVPFMHCDDGGVLHSPQVPPHPSLPHCLPVHWRVQQASVSGLQTCGDAQSGQVPPHPSGTRHLPEHAGVQALHFPVSHPLAHFVSVDE